MSLSTTDFNSKSTEELYVIAILCIDIILGRKALEKHELESDKNHNVRYGAIVNEISTLNKVTEELTLFSK
jgi:hypothetical protein